MRLELLFTSGIAICGIVVLWLMSLGGHEFWDMESILWMFLLLIQLQAIIIVNIKQRDVVVVTFLLGLCLAYVQRCLVVMAIPYSFDFGLCKNPTAFEFNRALAYLVLGTLATWGGVQAARLLIRLRHWRRKMSCDIVFVSRRGIFLYSGITLLLTAYLILNRGIGVSGGESSNLGFLIRIFDVDIMLYPLVIFIGLYWRCLGKSERFVVLLLLLGYVFVSLLRGQRGGVASLVIVYFFARLASSGYLRVTRKEIVATLLSVGLLIGVFYDLAWSIRYVWQDEGNLSTQAVKNRVAGDKTGYSIEATALEVSSRAGEIDRLTAVVNNWGGDVKEFASGKAFFSSILKGFLPSQIFNPTSIDMSRAFAYLFRGTALDVQHAEHWGGFGIAHGYFGWYGGLVAVFLFSMVCVCTYHVLPSRETATGVLFRTYFLAIFVFAVFMTGYMEVLVPQLLRSVIVILGICWITPKVKARQDSRSSQTTAEVRLGPAPLI